MNETFLKFLSLIQASFEETKEFRLNHEQFWIDTLNTVQPSGMNIATSKPTRKTEQIPLIIPPQEM